MSLKKKFSLLSIFLLIHLSLKSQDTQLYKLYNQLAPLISKNFFYTDTNSISQKTDFAILRIIQFKDSIKIEYASFDNAFKNSLAALKDSLKKKWIYKEKISGISLYIPIVFLFDENYPNPNYSFIDMFEFLKPKKSNCSRQTKFLWLEPVIISKRGRVN